MFSFSSLCSFVFHVSMSNCQLKYTTSPFFFLTVLQTLLTLLSLSLFFEHGRSIKWNTATMIGEEKKPQYFFLHHVLT